MLSLESHKGPFKNYVTAKLANFDPPSPPCHRHVTNGHTPPPPLVTGLNGDIISRKI